MHRDVSITHGFEESGTGMTHVYAPDSEALENRLRDHEHGTD
jgi:hypothetical protein